VSPMRVWVLAKRSAFVGLTAGTTSLPEPDRSDRALRALPSASVRTTRVRLSLWDRPQPTLYVMSPCRCRGDQDGRTGRL